MSTLDRKITQRGRMIVGGLVAAGVIAGGVFLPTLGSDGTEQEQSFAAFLPVVIDVSATGSTAAQSGTAYDSFCILNPLVDVDAGSGTIVRATHHNIRNPDAATMNIGFVQSCDDLTASGSDLFTDTCTATGCVDYYTTGTLKWQGSGANTYKYLKGTLRKDPTSSYDAKVTIWLEDILGE